VPLEELLKHAESAAKALKAPTAEELKKKAEELAEKERREKERK